MKLPKGFHEAVVLYYAKNPKFVKVNEKGKKWTNVTFECPELPLGIYSTVEDITVKEKNGNERVARVYRKVLDVTTDDPYNEKFLKLKAGERVLLEESKGSTGPCIKVHLDDEENNNSEQESEHTSPNSKPAQKNEYPKTTSAQSSQSSIDDVIEKAAARMKKCLIKGKELAKLLSNPTSEDERSLGTTLFIRTEKV